MISTMTHSLIPFLLLVLIVGRAPAQPIVYASVLSSKAFVVGAANPNTGLHFQRAGDDTTWQHTGAMRIRAFGMAADVSSKGQTLYIASGNGLHKTSDGGKTWRITTGWEITEVLGVSPDPRNSNIVYIATAYGIFKTTDGCVTWKEMNNGIPFPPFTQCVIIDHDDSNTLYCASESGLYLSHDAAASWNRTGLHVPNVRTVVQHPRDPLVLLAGTEEHGIYRTSNGGKWWMRTQAGLDHVTFYAIAFDPVHPDTMYAGGYVTGVYKSVDGGTRWTHMHHGLEYPSVHSLAVDPTNSSRVYAGTFWGGVYRSDNGGEQWNAAGIPGGEIGVIAIHTY
jgi:photosystem II stability/assembly factor-like uncharacterized protein